MAQSLGPARQAAKVQDELIVEATAGQQREQTPQDCGVEVCQPVEVVHH